MTLAVSCSQSERLHKISHSHPKMQKTIFLLLSFSIALSLSNPIAEREHILNVGDVIAVFDSDEPDQPAVLFAVQQAPLDESVTLRSLTAEESKNEDDMAKKDCEGCDVETDVQERSFLFKKLLLSKFIRPIAVPMPSPAPVSAPARPAVPSAFLIGTIYQPTSFVAAPIKATGSVAGLSASSQAAMALALPATRPVIRPSVGGLTGESFLGTSFAGQQLPQMLLGGGQPAVQMVAPSTGFSSISVGQSGSVSAPMMLGSVPQSSVGVQLAASRPSMVTVPIDALAAQGVRPPSGLFPNPAGQGNIGINIQQGGVPHPSNGPTPNSVATINISSAELPGVESAELAETTGATSLCSTCTTSPCFKC